jgi:hypothetical protein
VVVVVVMVVVVIGSVEELPPDVLRRPPRVDVNSLTQSGPLSMLLR